MESKLKILIKGMFKVTIAILVIMLLPVLMSKVKIQETLTVAESNNEYLKFYDFNPNAKTGTKENPFIILEIVPYRGMGQIGYLVGGQEPVDPSVSTYEKQLYGVFNGFAQGAFKVKKIKKDVLEAVDNVYAWEWKSYKLENQEGYFQKVDDLSGLYDKDTSGSIVTFVKNKYGTGNYNWVSSLNSGDKTTDYTSDQVWMKNYTLDVSCYENIGDWLFENKEIFKRDVLHISEAKLDSYYVRVVTITPDELRKNVEKFTKYYDLSDHGKNNKVYVGANSEGEIDLIGNADLISISPSAQAGKDSLIEMWELYGRDKSGISSLQERTKEGFDKNDLDWQTSMELFMKVGVVADKAPLVYDITCFDQPKIEIKKVVPCLIGTETSTGYLNNMYKLLLLLRQRNPVEIYNLYFNTFGGEETSSVSMTTVYGKTTGSFDIQRDSDAKVYWSFNTFLPPFPNGKFPEYISQLDPDYRKYLMDSNIILGWGDIHDAVIRNTYSYNGTSNIVQRFIHIDGALKEVSSSESDKKVGYNKEFFDYLKNKDTAVTKKNASPCEAVEYILNAKRNNQKDSITVLDIEPCNEFNLTEIQLQRLIPAFSGNIKIVRQTTAEFIGKVEDLNSTYDLIYIGTNTGKMNVDASGKTIYNDPLMDGLVYSHMGDRILGFDNLHGVLKEGTSDIKAMDSINFGDDTYSTKKIFKGYNNVQFSYIKNVADFYRFSGNDITKLKKQELEEYILGGYPVLLEGQLYDCNTSIIDDSSNLFSFIVSNKIKNELVNKEHILNVSTQSLTQKRLLELINKEKVLINMTESPKEYQVDDLSSLIEDRALKYVFQIQSTSGKSTDKYNWSIYVDSNADGRFIEKEKILSGVASSGSFINISKRLSEKYVGVIPWKLVITDQKNANIRAEKIGYAAFKVPNSSAEESKKTRINILQITSNNSTLNLEELMNPPRGKTSLFYEFTKNLDDFNVQIKTISVEEFLNLYKGTGNAYDKNQPDVTDKLYFVDKGMKKAYDMLIFGFGDSYSDISNDNGALFNVQAFIDSGKSVMFTHDTTSFVNIKVDGEYYDNTKTGKTLINWGYGFNQFLRNRVGLDRFGVMREVGDTTPYDTATMPSKVVKEIYKSGALTNYQTTYPEIQGYTYGNLVAFGNPSNNPWVNIHEANKAYPPFAYGNEIKLGTNIDQYFTRYATKVNEGQITNYPYKIINNLYISETHTQYYQLNMEDPEIVVWYSLSDKEGNLFNPERSKEEIDTHSKEVGPYSVSPNDVRNNYYIYSKGNIMYTGVGHSSMDQLIDAGDRTSETWKCENEVKLFINTIIASYNAGVSSPNVAITNEEAIKNNSLGYLLYEDSEGYAKAVGATKKIKFIAEDRNLFTDELIVRVYSYDNDGNIILLNPAIKKMDGSLVSSYNESGKESGYVIRSDVEYYFEFPLEAFAVNGTDKIMIRVTNQHNLTGSTNAIIQNRILFDLD